jgi:hypothetical protein
MEVGSWIELAVGGWRYLFSSKYRTQMQERWRHESVGYVVWDVFWWTLGVVVSIGLVVLLFARG